MKVVALSYAIAVACVPPVLAQAKAKPVAEVSMRVPDGPMTVVVSIGSQRMRVFDRHGALIESPVSTGRDEFETPQGVFAIIERNKEHFSNLYDDAPMPNMQRITWSGVALHAGHVPGYRASHGCIRLPEKVSERLFDHARLGTRVVVAAHDVEPAPITHPRLFSPRPADAEVMVVDASGGVGRGSSPLAGKMLLGATVLKPLPVATPGLPPTSDPFAGRPASVSRSEWVAQLQARARDTALEARDANAKSTMAKKEAAHAARLMAAAEKKRMALARDVADIEARIAKAGGRPAARLERAKSAVTDKLVQAVALADKLAEVDDQKRSAAARLAHVAAEAEQRRVTANAKSREVSRSTKPVSVFVSRKTGRLYVRQGFEPLFNVPVGIRDADAPIGTHVFTAVTNQPSSNEMEWTALTVVGFTDDEMKAINERAKQRRRKPEQPIGPPQLTASAALDRLEIPDDVRDRIATMLVPGSSLIVSDRGISPETGKGTDFVIETN